MNEHDGLGMMERLAAIDPARPHDTTHLSDEPTARRTLERIMAERIHGRGRGREVVRTGLVVAAAGGALVVGLLTIPGAGPSQPHPVSPSRTPVIQPGVRTAPNTPDGHRTALAAFREMVARGKRQRPVPAGSVRAVFNWISPEGTYTLWRAQGISAVLFSSPRTGLVLTGGGDRPPTAPFVVTSGGVASVSSGRREGYGRASAEIARVRIRLSDGTLADAQLRDGWWVFAEDIGHPRPVGLLGLDLRGLVIVRQAGRLF